MENYYRRRDKKRYKISMVSEEDYRGIPLVGNRNF